MLYIGPWLEYKLAKQLEESNTSSSHPQALRLPQNSRRKSALPSISFHRPTKCSIAKSENDCTSIPTVLPAYTQKRRDFYGETRSLRRFQNELSSLGSPTRKATPRTGKPSGRTFPKGTSGSSPSQRVSTGTNKRLAQIQRMQSIYRQGQERAQAQVRDKPRQDKNILPSIYSNTKAPHNTSMSLSPQVRASISADDQSDDDDELLSWVGGLDLGGI